MAVGSGAVSVRTRCEVVGGLVNSAFMLAVCLTLTVDAIKDIVGGDKKIDDENYEENNNIILWTAIGGLILNVFGPSF